MSPKPFNRILVEREVRDYDYTKEVLRGFSGTPIQDPPEQEKAGPYKDDKDTLLLMRFPGSFLRPCPGTKSYICCGYQILHAGINCPMNCSYCILQAYINQPFIRLFANLEQELEQVSSYLDSRPDRIFRIGTGEFMDSLVLDPFFHWTGKLLPVFSRKKNAVLELKTKSDCIEGLLSSTHRDRIIVSWSLNGLVIASREEHGAPAIRKRLEAARRCQSRGFVLGFHFDPLIDYPGWKEDYLRTFDLLDRYIDPKGVIWVSLGCIRFMPGLKRIIRRRHPKSLTLDGEFILGLDGKMRYFKPIRIEMYGYMAEKLGTWSKDLGLYLCMESDEVWQKGLGWSPGDSAGLSRYLDARVGRLFPG